MSDFKAKMHQIRFRLGLRPRPRWGSLHRSPDPLAGLSCLLLLLTSWYQIKRHGITL